MQAGKRALYTLLAATPVLFAGCYPQQPDYIEEYDLVYTTHSPNYDFTSATTYAIPDSVVILDEGLEEGEIPNKVDPEFGDLIIKQIRDNMNSRGWTEVAATADPDVVILPSALKTLNIDAYYYWGGYWGWYYPPYYGWGWYYPGYYPTYTSYTTGSLVIQMNSPGDVSPSEQVPVQWVAIINGLLEGSDSSIKDRLKTNIDQAFAQSEYLKH